MVRRSLIGSALGVFVLALSALAVGQHYEATIPQGGSFAFDYNAQAKSFSGEIGFVYGKFRVTGFEEPGQGTIFPWRNYRMSFWAADGTLWDRGYMVLVPFLPTTPKRGGFQLVNHPGVFDLDFGHE